MTASAQGVRAVEHFLAELYDSTRGIAAAYVVDSGDIDGAPIEAPPWADLTHRQRIHFMAHAYPVFEILMGALTATIEGGDQT